MPDNNNNNLLQPNNLVAINTLEDDDDDEIDLAQIFFELKKNILFLICFFSGYHRSAPPATGDLGIICSAPTSLHNRGFTCKL